MIEAGRRNHVHPTAVTNTTVTGVLDVLQKQRIFHSVRQTARLLWRLRQNSAKGHFKLKLHLKVTELH